VSTKVWADPSDDCRGKEVPCASNEILGYIDVAQNKVLGGVIKDATELARYTIAEEFGDSSRPFGWVVFLLLRTHSDNSNCGTH
jgi:hypothetical protein